MELMAQQDDERSRLVRLDDFEGELEETWQEAQGLKVFDKNGDEVGTVEDLYIYKDAEAVHLIKVEVEGSHVLIPVDAARSASEDGVELEQDKDTIAASPEHDSDDVPDSETSRKAYEHFGYPDQLALG
jgi:sporulation protein YlmC with PRC-barrel domain